MQSQSPIADDDFKFPVFSVEEIRKLGLQLLDVSKFIFANVPNQSDDRVCLAQRLSSCGILMYSVDFSDLVISAKDSLPLALPVIPQTHTLSDYSTGC